LDTIDAKFPEAAYREAPSPCEYRYIQRKNRTYPIEPTTSVIEEIDQNKSELRGD
jgi:hypothetical protein